MDEFAILPVMVHLASIWKCRHIPPYLMMVKSPNFEPMDNYTITSAMIRLVMNICSFVAARCPVGSTLNFVKCEGNIFLISETQSWSSLLH